jgi:hypothetical protein
MDPHRLRDDPAHTGHSVANVIEILVPLLHAVGARSVVEVGSYAGDLTRELLRWAHGVSARVTAVDPAPQPELVELAERHPQLELVREASHDALGHLQIPDAVIIDGDHNYYTVSDELRLVDERAPEGELPLLIFHDVGWPHGRRDVYYDPGRIPEEHRGSMVAGARLFPGNPGIAERGFPYPWAAAREGGPRNGVRTAIEDFVGDREGLRLTIVPAFFGLGVVWRERAPWADEVAAVLDPWDRNPMLARLEANRVHHLATEHAIVTDHIMLERLASNQQQLLRELLDSKAFAWAERLSRLRQGGRPRFSRDQVRRALGGEEQRG